VKKEPWRLNVVDELDDCIIKLKAIKGSSELLLEAKKIQELCYLPIKDLQKFKERLTRILNKTTELLVGDICSRK